MQRSQELLDAYTRTLQSIQDGSIASIDDTLSSSDAVSVFGTEGNAWIGRDQFVPLLDAQWTTFRDLGATIQSNAEAWTDGDLGFVVDAGRVTLRDGQSLPVRWTTILRKEGGEWKALHQHASFSAPTDLEALNAFNDALAGAVTQR